MQLTSDPLLCAAIAACELQIKPRGDLFEVVGCNIATLPRNEEHGVQSPQLNFVADSAAATAGWLGSAPAEWLW
jgi:hypothetical protein